MVIYVIVKVNNSVGSGAEKAHDMVCDATPDGRADRGLRDLGATESSHEIFFTCQTSIANHAVRPCPSQIQSQLFDLAIQARQAQAQALGGFAFVGPLAEHAADVQPFVVPQGRA